MKRTILLVDDNHMIRAALMRLLGTEYRVVYAADVAQAVDAVNRHAPGLVLSDVDMGSGDDGVRLVISLREKHPQLPVILMTAGDAKLAGEQAGVLCLEKPTPADVLFAAIRERLPVVVRRAGQSTQAAVNDIFHLGQCAKRADCARAPDHRGPCLNQKALNARPDDCGRPHPQPSCICRECES